MKKISNKFLNLRRNLARRENLYRGNLVSKITNLDDSASTKYWEVNSAQKETDKRMQGIKNSRFSIYNGNTGILRMALELNNYSKISFKN